MLLLGGKRRQKDASYNVYNAIGAFSYVVEVDNEQCCGFSNITGIASEVEVEPYHEGGRNNYIHMLPKGIVSQRMVLEKGVAINNAFFNWYKKVLQGQIIKKNVYISLKDNLGENIKKTWMFVGAYPVKWIGPELDGLSTEVAVERIEIVYSEMIER